MEDSGLHRDCAHRGTRAGFTVSIGGCAAHSERPIGCEQATRLRIARACAVPALHRAQAAYSGLPTASSCSERSLLFAEAHLQMSFSTGTFGSLHRAFLFVPSYSDHQTTVGSVCLHQKGSIYSYIQE